MVLMSPFSWQCQNQSRLSLAFIIDGRVVLPNISRTHCAADLSRSLPNIKVVTPTIHYSLEKLTWKHDLCKTFWRVCLQLKYLFNWINLLKPPSSYSCPPSCFGLWILCRLRCRTTQITLHNWPLSNHLQDFAVRIGIIRLLPFGVTCHAYKNRLV